MPEPLTAERPSPHQQGRAWAYVWPKLLYLASGTAITLYSQWIASKRMVHTSTHILAWTKYTFVFLSSRIFSSMDTAETAPMGASGQALLLLSGIVDVASYTLACVGFTFCGTLVAITVTAIASQVFNATMSVFVLRRRIPAGRYVALLVVACGGLIKSFDYWSPSKDVAGQVAAWPGQALAGVVCLSLSSLGYSTLGVLYERLLRSNPKITFSQYQQSTAMIGFVATTLYQILFTTPRYEDIVCRQLDDCGMTIGQLVAVLFLFGTLFNCNSYFQALLFKQEDGAVGVGIVTAARGALSSVLSGLVFCTLEAPWQCLTPWRIVSAAVVAAGVALWAVHSPAWSGKGQSNEADTEKKEE